MHMITVKLFLQKLNSVGKGLGRAATQKLREFYPLSRCAEELRWRNSSDPGRKGDGRNLGHLPSRFSFYSEWFRRSGKPVLGLKCDHILEASP